MAARIAPSLSFSLLLSVPPRVSLICGKSGSASARYHRRATSSSANSARRFRPPVSRAGYSQRHSATGIPVFFFLFSPVSPVRFPIRYVRYRSAHLSNPSLTHTDRNSARYLFRYLPRERREREREKENRSSMARNKCFFSLFLSPPSILPFLSLSLARYLRALRHNSSLTPIEIPRDINSFLLFARQEHLPHGAQ